MRAEPTNQTRQLKRPISPIAAEMASKNKIVVSSKIFVDDGKGEEVIFQCDAQADKSKIEIVQEDFQYTYTGKHDHGDMPVLKEGSGICKALKQVKEKTNAFLTQKIESEKQPKLKKQKLTK